MSANTESWAAANERGDYWKDKAEARPSSGRSVIGLLKRPTSCRCGGSTAWVLVTLLDGEPAGDMMLGCVCHTTLEQLADLLARTMGGDVVDQRLIDQLEEKA